MRPLKQRINTIKKKFQGLSPHFDKLFQVFYKTPTVISLLAYKNFFPHFFTKNLENNYQNKFSN
jgi:hypothetical protein